MSSRALSWVDVSGGVFRPGECAAMIFDFDGTLVDSQPVLFPALAEALARCGVHLDPGWYFDRPGVAHRDLVRALDPGLDVGAVLDTAEELSLARIGDVRVIEPVARLARGRGPGVPAAIATGSSRRFVRAGLDAAKLAGVFDVVVVRDDVARGKPAPDIFLRAAGLLGVPARCCVVFEDADTGIVAALAAGMRVIDVRRHLHPPNPDPYRRSGPGGR